MKKGRVGLNDLYFELKKNGVRARTLFSSISSRVISRFGVLSFLFICDNFLQNIHFPCFIVLFGVHLLSMSPSYVPKKKEENAAPPKK